MRVLVSIAGTQRVDGETDTIELSAEGHLSVANGQWVLSYAERDEEGSERFTTLRCTDREAQMERSGAHRTLLLLQPGRRCVCEYGTPYGSLAVGVHTHTLHNRLTLDGGTLDVTYSLDLAGGAPIENALHIAVQKTER